MGSKLSPILGVRADIQLMSPAIALLMVQVPVGFGNAVRLHKGIGWQAVRVLARLSYPVAHKFCIYARVNNKMCHVDVFRS